MVRKQENIFFLYTNRSVKQNFTDRTIKSNVILIKCHRHVTGGYDGNTFLDSVECYDPEKDTWAEVTRITSGRSGVGVAVTMEPCQKDLSQCQKTDRENGAAPPAHQSTNHGFTSHHNQQHSGSFGKGS